MPQVNVTNAAVSTVLEATRASGPQEGSIVNRGPNSAWVEIAAPNAGITTGAGAGNATELKMGESIQVALARGEALRAKCAATETARLDVLASDAD